MEELPTPKVIEVEPTPEPRRDETAALQQKTIDNALVNWDNVTKETCTKYTFAGTKMQAKVLGVYDGDSVTIASFFFTAPDGTPFLMKCRLFSIDTPELKTRDIEEKKAGYAARDALRELILDQVVWVTCGDFDKYGRMLIAIETLDGVDVNSWMIENGHALAYDGGTKTKFQDGNYAKQN